MNSKNRNTKVLFTLLIAVLFVGYLLMAFTNTTKTVASKDDYIATENLKVQNKLPKATLVKSEPDTIEYLFFKRVQEEEIAITILLTNGVEVRGLVQGFDDSVVILDVSGKIQIIYKHAIASMQMNS